MNSEECFPTVIYNDYINTDGLEKISYDLKNNPTTIQRVISNRGGWQSDVLKNEMFSKLIDDIETKALEIYNENYEPGTGRYKVMGIWVNINSPGAFNIRHQHPRTDLAGTVYVKTPKNCGDIVFEDPRETHRLHEDDNDLMSYNKSTFRTISYTPKIGQVLFFPGWLAHRVEQNKSDDDRISIAFNMTVDQTNYNIMRLIKRQINE